MKFQKRETSCFLESYQGNDSNITIPAYNEALPVTKIGAKAFLSCKSVVHLTLPETIEEIGDWAFAHMKNLKTLTLPAHPITYGKNVFLDCINLSEIHILQDNSKNSGLPYFLASSVTMLKKPSLCSPERAGNSQHHMNWMEDYDKTLIQFLSEPDNMGFEPVFIGWFSVEDLDSQTQRFTGKRQQEKTFLAFQRLLYPDFLADSTRKILYDYLADHMPEGARAQEHTFPFSMLCNEFRDDIRYLKIVADTGYITAQTLPLLQEGLQNSSPEIIAFLLRYQQNFTNSMDFFSGLSL